MIQADLHWLAQQARGAISVAVGIQMMCFCHMAFRRKNHTTRLETRGLGGRKESEVGNGGWSEWERIWNAIPAVNYTATACYFIQCCLTAQEQKVKKEMDKGALRGSCLSCFSMCSSQQHPTLEVVACEGWKDLVPSPIRPHLRVSATATSISTEHLAAKIPPQKGG